jgi:hypothetical protein
MLRTTPFSIRARLICLNTCVCVCVCVRAQTLNEVSSNDVLWRPFCAALEQAPKTHYMSWLRPRLAQYAAYRGSVF